MSWFHDSVSGKIGGSSCIGERLRRPTRGGQPRQLPGAIEYRHNGIVAAPGPAESTVLAGIAQRDGIAAVHRDLLEFALGEKRDPPSVGREEW